MVKFNFLFLFFCGILINAQIITGKIISEETNKPISFVKIGIENENVGSNTDVDGNFTLNLESINSQKMVRVEAAGFEMYRVSIKDFIKSNSQTIILKEKTHDIAEVKISPKKLVEKNWGVNTKSKSILYSVNPNLRKEEYLRETALAFDTKKLAKILKINLNIAGFTSDKPVVLRYGIYSDNGGMPGELINDEELTIQLTKEKIIDGTVTLDVTKSNIWVQGKFFVGIQFMNDFDGRIYISAALMRTGFTRSFYGNWEKMPIAAPAINIDVKIDKNYKNHYETERNGNNLNNLPSAELLTSIEKFKSEAERTSYGRNEAQGKVFKGHDIETYYESYGNGEPLFLLHGNSGSIKDFYRQIPQFSEKYRVYAVDTRAQGKSKDFTKNDFTYMQFANDLKQLVDYLKLDRINIVGWSDGGNTALLFALNYPQYVNKMVLVGANLFPEGVDQTFINEIRVGYKRLESENNPENQNQLRLMKLMLEQPNIKPELLNAIRNPVLVTAGEKDVILESHTKLIHKSIPNSNLKIFKGASHYVVQEQPKEFNKAVLKFLND